METIDRLVGQRGRSRFLAEAARRELAYRELVAVAKAAMGSGKDLHRPWGDTPASITDWVEGLGSDGSGRDEGLDAARQGQTAAA